MKFVEQKEDKIAKILNETATLTALVRDQSLEKFPVQLKREDLVADSIEI